MKIRSYRGTDETALLALWQATMTHDLITPSVWRTKVLLDPNSHPDGLLVAEIDGALVGFRQMRQFAIMQKSL